MLSPELVQEYNTKASILLQSKVIFRVIDIYVKNAERRILLTLGFSTLMLKSNVKYSFAGYDKDSFQFWH